MGILDKQSTRLFTFWKFEEAVLEFSTKRQSEVQKHTCFSAKAEAQTSKLQKNLENRAGQQALNSGFF